MTKQSNEPIKTRWTASYLADLSTTQTLRGGTTWQTNEPIKTIGLLRTSQI